MGNSDFLVVQPSVLNGIARNLDLFATFTDYNISDSPKEADYRALIHDARAIYKDMQAALDSFEKEHAI